MLDLLTACIILLLAVGYICWKIVGHTLSAARIVFTCIALFALSFCLVFLGAALKQKSELSLKVCAVNFYSEAEKSGFRRGQILKTLDGETIANQSQFSALAKKKQGQRVAFAVEEGGVEKQLYLTLGKISSRLMSFSHADLTALYSGIEFNCGYPYLIHNLHPYLREQDMDLVSGLRILRINGRPVPDSGTLRDAVKNLSDQKSYTLSVLLDGQERIVYGNFGWEWYPPGYSREYFKMQQIGALAMPNHVVSVPEGIHWNFTNASIIRFNGSAVFPSEVLQFVEQNNFIDIGFYYSGVTKIKLGSEQTEKIRREGFVMRPELAEPFIPGDSADVWRVALHEYQLMLKNTLSGANSWLDYLRTWRWMPKRWYSIQSTIWQNFWYWLALAAQVFILIAVGLAFLLIPFFRRTHLRNAYATTLLFLFISICLFANNLIVVRIIR